MKIYKNKSSADRYECTSCGTNFSSADLQFDCQLSGLGKYTVKPDVKECPFCYASLDETRMDTQIVDVATPVDANRPIEPGPYTHYPETVEQNCTSATHTIKPQINWEIFDEEHADKINRAYL